MHEPEVITEATERIKTILDAKYEKADLREVAEEATHLNKEEQNKLHQLLTKYEDLFDGSLGKWKMDAYDVELRPDATPYHLRHIRFHKSTLPHLKWKWTGWSRQECFDRSTTPSGLPQHSSSPRRMVQSDLYLISGN